MFEPGGMLERGTPRLTRDSAAVSSAELIARAALAETGASVLRLRVASVEPRGHRAITGVEVDLMADDVPERRICYIDESRSPAGIWVHPDDPRLPALAPATFPHALAALLSRVGVGEPLADVELVAYRPGRRGVVRARCGARTIWAKVTRPDRVEAIVERHRMLRDAGLPVPAVLGWSPAGVLVLENAAGTALTSVVGDVDLAAALREVQALRSRLSTITGVEASGRPTVPARADWYAGRLGERMPQLIPRLRPLSRFAAATLGDAGRPTIAMHGDLHAGQLFVDAEARITGLIDVDTVALGEAGTDPGTFLAHALASAEVAEARDDHHRAAGFRALAHRGAETWLDQAPAAEARSARRHAVGQLLAQAMHLAHADGLDAGAERLVGAAEHVADGSPLTGVDEEALIGATAASHLDPRT